MCRDAEELVRRQARQTQCGDDADGYSGHHLCSLSDYELENLLPLRPIPCARRIHRSLTDQVRSHAINADARQRREVP